MGRVLLLDIGAGALPALTPVTAPSGTWMPLVYVPPPPPTPTSFAVLELVSAIRATWDAVNEPNVRYELERAPDVAGLPGTPLQMYRGTDRVYNSPESARTHWRVRSQVRGRNSTWSAWVAQTPVSPSALLAGNGVNLLRDDYVSFISLPPTGSNNATRALDTGDKIFDGALQLSWTTGAAWSYIGQLAGDMYLKAGTYIVSSWIKSSVANLAPRWMLRNATSGTTYNSPNLDTGPANTWDRLGAAIVVPVAGWYALAFDPPDNTAVTVRLDGIMVEAALGASSSPSAFVRGVARPMVLSAIAAAAAAQDTADGKIETFIQSTAPAGGKLGDLWFDTSNGNRMSRHNGTSWVVTQDTAIGTAILNAAGAQATADGKVRTWFLPSNTPPTASAVGDLWFQTDKMLFLRWNGSAWSFVAGNVCAKNLIVNPTGMHDFDGWSNFIGSARQRLVIRKESFGFAFACDGPNTTTAIDYGAGQNIPATQGTVYTLSGNMYTFHMGGTNNCILQMRFFNASMVEIDTGNRPTVWADNNYNGNDRRYTVTGTSPTGTAFVQILFRASGTFQTAPNGFLRFWDLKLERSDVPTPYSDDATPKASPIDSYEETVTGGTRWRNGLRVGNSGQRIGAQRNLVQSLTTSYGSVRSSTALSATSAGAVTVNAFSQRYGSFTVSYNAVANAVTGLTPGTSYVIYCVDAAFTGGTKTYFAGSNPDAVMQLGDDVVVVGQITIPTSGSSSGGGGSGGGDPGNWCVDWDTVLPDGRLVRDLRLGDLVECLDVASGKRAFHPLQGIAFGKAKCVHVRTRNGYIVQSCATPMDLPDGRQILTSELLGEPVFAHAADAFEPVLSLAPAGFRKVVKVNFGNRMFLAGHSADSCVATHNMKPLF